MATDGSGRRAGPRTPVSSRWWLDLEGYWRDEVVKDLVKHGVQVVVGVFVAVTVGVIEPTDARAAALVGFAAVTTAAANCALAVWYWRPANSKTWMWAGPVYLLSLMTLAQLPLDSRVLAAIVALSVLISTGVIVARFVRDLSEESKWRERLKLLLVFAITGLTGTALVVLFRYVT